MIYQAGFAAAAIHRFMSEDPRFGYTQGNGRWGWSPSGAVALFNWQGFTYKIPAGDYDCASSVTMAWQKALEPTAYNGALGEGGYNSSGLWVSWYTGNINPGFRASRLFFAEHPSFIASPGDLYLHERQHVAMCQTQEPDVLSEFVSNEVGGIVGGAIGDQTGGESRLAAYYDFPPYGWDVIMHYNGLADFEIGEIMEPVDVWAYKNPELTRIDAYAHLLEMHAESKQALRELAALGADVAELKRKVQELSKN